MDQDTTSTTRRGFLKVATGSLLGVSVLALGSGVSALDFRLTMDGWRARPGTPLPVSLEWIEKQSKAPVAQELVASLVSLDARGMVESVLGDVKLLAEGPGRWGATIEAPPGHPDNGESFQLAVAFLDAGGRLAMSSTVEIICTPFHAGF